MDITATSVPFVSKSISTTTTTTVLMSYRFLFAFEHCNSCTDRRHDFYITEKKNTNILLFLEFKWYGKKDKQKN